MQLPVMMGTMKMTMDAVQIVKLKNCMNVSLMIKVVPQFVYKDAETEYISQFLANNAMTETKLIRMDVRMLAKK